MKSGSLAEDPVEDTSDARIQESDAEWNIVFHPIRRFSSVEKAELQRHLRKARMSITALVTQDRMTNWN